VLPDAVPHHPAQPLHRLLPHLAVSPPPLGVWGWVWVRGCGCGGGGRETEFRIQHSN
jgi:hypothetical protein